MKNVFVILFLTSIVFASCNEEPKPLNITKIENKKPTIDDLISTTKVRNLPPKDIRNIDSLRGYKMLKLGIRIDEIDTGSFVNCIVIGNLTTLYRRQDKEVVKLSFYKRILVRIEIENETIKTLRPNIDGDGIFVWQEDLLNTFGEPNIKKSTIKSKVNELPITTTLNLIWQSKNNLVIQYVLKESTVFRHSPPRFIGDDEVILEDAGTERSFVYSITDNSCWKIYEKERNYAVEKEKSEERMLKKKKDSLKIISSQNNL